MNNNQVAKEELRELMIEVSEEYLNTRWSFGLEFLLWSKMIHGPKGTEDIIGNNIDGERFKKLAKKAKGWWAWPEDEEEPVFMKMAEWKAYYKEYAPIYSARKRERDQKGERMKLNIGHESEEEEQGLASKYGTGYFQKKKQ